MNIFGLCVLYVCKDLVENEPNVIEYACECSDLKRILLGIFDIGMPPKKRGGC